MTQAQSDKISIVDIYKRAGWSGKAALIMATWFGSGLAPRAPGTFGTLAAIPLILIYRLGPVGSIAALAGIIAVAVWSAHRTGELLGKRDPSEVVIDEAAGLFITLFLLPVTWKSILLGFILFRFFDIVKPWPVRQSERLEGGFGIVADDLLAGVYAHLILRGVLWLAG